MPGNPSSPDSGGPGPDPNSAPNPGSPNTAPDPNSSNPNTAPNPGTTNPNTAPGTTPPSPDDDPIKLKVVIGNFDKNVDSFAREAAHEEMAEKATGGFFKRFAKNVWNNVTREYQIVKRTGKKREEIIANDNVRHHQGEDDSKYREGAVRRAASEFGDKLIHEEAGESYNNLNEIINNTVVDPNADPDKDPAAKRVKQAERIKGDTLKLVRDFAVHSSDPDYIPDKASLEQAFKRVAKEWKDDGITEDLLGEGNLWGHNVVEMALQARAAADTKTSLDAVQRGVYVDTIVNNAEVVAAELKVGSNVEIDARLSERIAEKMKGRKIFTEGNISKVVSVLGNELFVGALLSAGVFLGRKGLSAALVVPGLGAAVVGGYRERRALKDERDLMARRLDNGEEPDIDVKRWWHSHRQERLAETMYESERASDLIDNLGVFYDTSGNLLVSNESEFNAAAAALGEIKARQMMEIREGKRLIDYGDETDERGYKEADLALAIAKLEAGLEKLGLDPANHAMLGITRPEEVAENVQLFTAISEGSIKGEIDAADRLFAKVQVYYSVKRGVITLGAAGGFHELADALGLQFGGRHKTESKLGHKEAPKMRPAAYTTNSKDGEGEPIGTDGANAEQGEPIGSAGASQGESIGEDAGEPIGSAAGEVPQGESIGTDSGEPIGTNGGSAGEPIGTSGGVSQGEPIGSGDQNGEPIGKEPGGASQGEPIGSAGATQQGEPIGSAGGEATQGEPIGEGTEGEPIGSAGGEKLGNVTELSKNAKIIMPDGFTSEVNGDQVVIHGPNGQTFAGQLDKNGALQQSTIDQIKAAGVRVDDRVVQVDGPLTMQEQTVSKEQFYENHKTEMVNVDRVGWLNNGTENEYDFNEQKYDVIRLPNGDVRLSIARMTPGGSWNSEQNVQWREAAQDGHIKAYLSASRGTQGHALEYTFNKDGYVDIPKDSTGASLFDEKGNFTGGFNEVALNSGQNADGAEKITPLATIVGERNGGTVTDHVFHAGPKVEQHTYTFTVPEAPTQGEPIGEPWRENAGFGSVSTPLEEGVAPSVPIYARTPLGRGKRRNGGPVRAPFVPSAPPPPSTGTGPVSGGIGAPRPGARVPGGPGPSTNPNTGPNFSAGGPGAPRNGGPRPGSPPPPANSAPNTGPGSTAAGGAGTAPNPGAAAGGTGNPASAGAGNPPNTGPANNNAGQTGNAGAGANAGPAAGTTGQSSTGNSGANNRPPTYTPDELTALGRIDAEAAVASDVPSSIGIDTSGIGEYSAKLVKLAYHRTVASIRPRAAYETDDAWEARIFDAMVESARENRRRLRFAIPPNLQPVFAGAYNAILTAYARTQGYSSGRQRP